MRKIIMVVLSATLVLGAFGAPAAEAGKKKKTRKAQGTYVAPATVIGNCTQSDGIGCMTIPTAGSEKYLKAKVTDESGLPVHFTVQADLDGNMSSETFYGSFCGETDKPIKFDGGAELIFWVSPITAIPERATSGCLPGQGTEGTLDVTFSNRP